jgi:hypothetical protein
VFNRFPFIVKQHVFVTFHANEDPFDAVFFDNNEVLELSDTQPLAEIFFKEGRSSTSST